MPHKIYNVYKMPTHFTNSQFEQVTCKNVCLWGPTAPVVNTFILFCDKTLRIVTSDCIAIIDISFVGDLPNYCFNFLTFPICTLLSYNILLFLSQGNLNIQRIWQCSCGQSEERSCCQVQPYEGCRSLIIVSGVQILNTIKRWKVRILN